MDAHHRQTFSRHVGARRRSVAVVLLLLALDATGQSGAGFEMVRSTIDGGGGTSTAGNFSLTGTIGQPDAHESSSGGSFQLHGGFFGPMAAAGPEGEIVFSDGFED